MSIKEMMTVAVGAVIAFIFWVVEAIFNFVIAEWKFLVLIGSLWWAYISLALTLEATERHLRYIRHKLDALHIDLNDNLGDLPAFVRWAKRFFSPHE